MPYASVYKTKHSLAGERAQAQARELLIVVRDGRTVTQRIYHIFVKSTRGHVRETDLGRSEASISQSVNDIGVPFGLEPCFET